MSIRKKPWNRVDLPVYSVSSKGITDNMHICTYVSAVSMQPKRMMVALYDGTRTLANVAMTGKFVLQLLHEEQYRLVNQLGKQSGNTIDKISRTWNNYYILKDALAVMELQSIQTIPAGDHTMFLCDVISYKNLNEGKALTTSILHEKGIIRI
jgi:flavin reductase (DIM6/NTAB) family NADH-FMN oxidoreductase RutF